MRRSRGARKSTKVDWQQAPDITRRVVDLVDGLGLDYLQKSRIICFRSQNSTSRAIARMWGLNRLWQLALGESPAYVLEVLGERFDKLPKRKQDEVLLHELAHVPKNFSGSLMPHRKGKGGFHDKLRKMLVAYQRL